VRIILGMPAIALHVGHAGQCARRFAHAGHRGQALFRRRLHLNAPHTRIHGYWRRSGGAS
jgi:hypothetical protein